MTRPQDPSAPSSGPSAASTSYRAWRLQEGFGLERLRLQSVAAEPLPAGHVRVRVLCAALNYRDWLVVQGRYDPRLPLPLVPLSDGVGRIVECAPGVEGLAPGQRVVGLFAPRWVAGPPRRDEIRYTLGAPGPGWLAEQIVLPASAVVPVPEHLSDAEACTLPCAALTAWSALVELGGLRPGQRVLTLGTGGVSIFALQFARLLGAQVAVTSSSDEKLRRARELGAQLAVNYRQDPQWGRTVRRWADGEGVDLVVEVGGAGTLAQSLRAVRAGGTVAVIGVLAGTAGSLDVLPLLMNQVRMQGVFVGHRRGFEAMCQAIEAHRLRPVVAEVYPFERAPEAFRCLAQGRHFGKVVVQVADDARP